ncbi:MAG: hypothetical protein MUO43_09530 [Desulfobacterales bacterium]|nr:hypothetical protein [Desulfobacterales bacterium]
MADYSLKSKFVSQLDEDVLNFILDDTESCDEDQFNQLALRQFELQYHTSEHYREYCKRKNISPETITNWEEIPAIPSFAFSDFVLSLPVEKAQQICSASRTAVSKNGRQKISRDKRAVELINTANGLLTKRFLFPDTEKMKIILMLPSPKMAPGMVMAMGLDQVRQGFGTPGSRFLISPLGLDIKRLISALRKADKTREPLALIGVAGGLIHFFDACEKEGIRFNLPKGSRICDVGRERGRLGECSKKEYFRKCRKTMGIEEDFCINILWTCESSTIYFDNALKNYFERAKKDRCKEMPPWTRTVVVDTGEFKRLSKGEVGLLRHYDLTNRVMAFAVQTAGLGFETEDGFEVIGRWNKKIGEMGVDHSLGHRGGRVATKVIDYVMRRQLSKVGKIYARLK